MTEVASAFEELAAYIEEHGNARGVPPARVLVSRFDELQNHLAAAERSSGFSLPEDLRELFTLCDGFTDPRYTNLHTLQSVINELTEFDGSRDGVLSIWIGDGCGLDEKTITLMHGKHFKDGVAKIVFHDYLLDIDEAQNNAFKERFTDDALTRWRASTEGDENAGDEMVDYGPMTTAEFLDYVLSTASQV
ncbi:MAG: hypothetical protein HC863_00280 [Myxococcales bacterium]|nr:hypothetical protein [Myxococcales bacterium]